MIAASTRREHNALASSLFLRQSINQSISQQREAPLLYSERSEQGKRRVHAIHNIMKKTSRRRTSRGKGDHGGTV